MTCVYLSSEDVLTIAELVVGDQTIVVRDAGLLESAVHRPSAAVTGQEAYTGLFDKAAALLQSLAFNRSFVDGNRCAAWASCVVFLAMNGVQLRPDRAVAERLVGAVATGDLEDVKAISEALQGLAEPPV